MKHDLSAPTKDFIRPLEMVLNPDQIISDVLSFLHISHSSKELPCFYVADEKGRLLGLVSPKSLLFKSPSEKISNIMDTSIVSASEDKPLEHVLELFTHHQFLTLPVVDHAQVLKGYVDVATIFGESLEQASKERKSDLFQFVGLHLEEGRRKTPFRNYMQRMPWIFCNLFGGFACAMISDYYEILISRYLVLAMFLPLVLSLSESVSMQTVMQTLLTLRNSPQSFSKYLKLFLKEAQVIVFVAATCAIIVGFMTPFWGETSRTSIAMSIGIFISIVLSSIVGSMIPIFLNKSTLDPKIAAGPVTLMIADVGTTMIYLSLCAYLLL